MARASCQINNFLFFQNNILQDLPGFFSSTRKTNVLTLEQLVVQFLRFGKRSITQEVIGRIIGRSRAHVNYAIKYLCLMGIITKKVQKRKDQPHKNKINEYTLHPLFSKNNNLILRMKNWLPRVRDWLSYKAQKFTDTTAHFKKVTHLKEQDVLRNIYSYLNVIKLKKGERVENPIPQVIRKLPLNLTHIEQIRLTVFPDDVIERAMSFISQRSHTISDKVSYLFKVCASICVEENLPIDTKYADNLTHIFRDNPLPDTHGDQQVEVPIVIKKPVYKPKKYKREIVQEDPQQVKKKFMENEKYIASCKALGIGFIPNIYKES